MTEEIKHDPEFPFLVTSCKGGPAIARFCSIWHARNYLHVNGTPFWEITDTTPKPRIPEDAAYITWRDPETRGVLYARRISFEQWVTAYQVILSEDELIDYIEGAEIFALDKRSN